MTTDIQLVSPFPREHYSLLWAWLLEFPLRNLDDSGPRDIEELALDIQIREAVGEKVYEVVHSGQPVGVIGYAPVTHAFHGICFPASVHGSGIPLAAVRMVIERAFRDGASVINLEYFADNGRVRAFLKKLGAKDTGLVKSTTPRDGKPVEWRTVEICPDAFFALHRQIVN